MFLNRFQSLVIDSGPLLRIPDEDIDVGITQSSSFRKQACLESLQLHTWHTTYV